jgi:hypothetical protein
MEDEGEVTDNPMRRMKPPAVPDKPVGVLTEEHLKRLLAVCAGRDFKARRDTALIMLLLDSGGRLTEKGARMTSAVPARRTGGRPRSSRSWCRAGWRAWSARDAPTHARTPKMGKFLRGSEVSPGDLRPCPLGPGGVSGEQGRDPERGHGRSRCSSAVQVPRTKRYRTGTSSDQGGDLGRGWSETGVLTCFSRSAPGGQADREALRRAAQVHLVAESAGQPQSQPAP